jgi:hypothetical protein
MSRLVLFSRAGCADLGARHGACRPPRRLPFPRPPSAASPAAGRTRLRARCCPPGSTWQSHQPGPAGFFRTRAFCGTVRRRVGGCAEAQSHGRGGARRLLTRCTDTYRNCSGRRPRGRATLEPGPGPAAASAMLTAANTETRIAAGALLLLHRRATSAEAVLQVIGLRSVHVWAVGCL